MTGMPSITSHAWVLSNGTATDHPNRETIAHNNQQSPADGCHSKPPVPMLNAETATQQTTARSLPGAINMFLASACERRAQPHAPGCLTVERQPQRSLPCQGNDRSNGNRPSNTDLICPPQPRCCWPASVTRMTLPPPSACPCNPTQPPVPGC